MAQGQPSVQRLHYETSARRRVQWWAMLIIGMVFAYAGATIDPQSNCNSDGECAPWLIPVAYCMGLMFAASGLGHLIVNPRSGSRLDPVSGELIWWQNRTLRSSGDEGHIAPALISRIRIVRESDGPDGVHLYDLKNERLPYFDHEVIPYPYDNWAKEFVRRYPHVRLDIEG